MRHPHFAVLVLLAVLWNSCSSPTATEADTGTLAQAREIYAETMALHDEVMPRMDELMQLRQKLELRVNSIREGDTAAHADSMQQMQTAIEQLQQADRHMMQWMRNIKQVPGAEGTETASDSETGTTITDTTNVIQIQRQQKAEMEQVKEQMENSITEARRLIGLPE